MFSVFRNVGKVDFVVRLIGDKSKELYDRMILLSNRFFDLH